MEKKQLSDEVIIIAEIGVNHEGDFDKAKEMISLAAESGADVVKFQTFIPEHYVSTSEKERLERVRKFALTFDQFRELSEVAQKNNVIFTSTPLCLDSLKVVDEISSIIKISSGDINNYCLLKAAAQTKKMVILSTGLSTVVEIHKAIEILKEGNDKIIDDKKLILLHCIAAYPTPEDQLNLKSIPFMKDEFKIPIGFSDHSKDILACQAAVCLGARVIEKHFTYSKENQTFHDHHLSADPCEFRLMVKAIRRIEKMLGEYQKKPMECEIPFKSHIRRSVAAAHDLNKGDILSTDNMFFVRPEKGISMEEAGLIIGKKVNKCILKGEIIFKEFLT